MPFPRLTSKVPANWLQLLERWRIAQPRPRKACDELARNGIGSTDEDNGDGAGRLLGSEYRGRARGHDHINLECNQFGRERREPFELPLGISIFDYEVAALDVAQVKQSLAETPYCTGTTGRFPASKPTRVTLAACWALASGAAPSATRAIIASRLFICSSGTGQPGEPDGSCVLAQKNVGRTFARDALRAFVAQSAQIDVPQ